MKTLSCFVFLPFHPLPLPSPFLPSLFIAPSEIGNDISCWAIGSHVTAVVTTQAEYDKQSKKIQGLFF